MNKKRSLPYLIANFFRLYLPGECGFSPATIASYRDTFKQLFVFIKARTGKEPEQLSLLDLNKATILGFLDNLEAEGKSISTRNQRLAAIKSFFNFVKYEAPESLDSISAVLQIRMKKTPEAIINFLSVDGVALILSCPDMHTRNGVRDAVMLTMLYDTAARVSELTEVRLGDIRLEAPATIILHGKNVAEIEGGHI